MTPAGAWWRRRKAAKDREMAPASDPGVLDPALVAFAYESLAKIQTVPDAVYLETNRDRVDDHTRVSAVALLRGGLRVEIQFRPEG